MFKYIIINFNLISKNIIYRAIIVLPFGSRHVCGMLGLQNHCRLFRCFTNVGHTCQTLRSLLAHTSERTDKKANCGVTYDIQCLECHQIYIGETQSALETPFKEHIPCRKPLLAISEHKLNTCHQRLMRDNIVLRTFKEVFSIYTWNASMKRDIGISLCRDPSTRHLDV